MVNKIWFLLIIISIVYMLITGNATKINDIVLETPMESFNIFIQLFVMLVFWNGILEIAKQGGFLAFIGKGIKKIIHPLFKKIPKEHIVFDYISGNIAANLLGLGNAATPMGLKAMEELKKISNTDIASNEMITLLIINTSGLMLIPTSILAIRKSYGANITVDIIPYIILMSVTTTLIALFVDYLFRKNS